MVDVELEGPCCFCGARIERTSVDPCAVSVETEDGLTQAWFCHARCFKERLSRDPAIDLTPAHF
jgi:hypothetical protein